MPPFANARQRKKVMMLLKKKGFKKKPLEIGVTPNYFRARMGNPYKFKKDSFRIVDVGRPGGTKIVVGREKGSNKTSLQSVLLER